MRCAPRCAPPNHNPPPSPRSAILQGGELGRRTFSKEETYPQRKAQQDAWAERDQKFFDDDDDW